MINEEEASEVEEPQDDDGQDAEQAAADQEADTQPADDEPAASAPEPVDDGQPRRYDFTHPQHRLNKPLSALAISANKVAVDLTTRIDNTLHLAATCTVATTELRKHQDISSTLKSGVCVFRVELGPQQGCCYLLIQPELTFALVQGFFGGNQSAVYEETDRALSTTEIRLGSRLRNTILEGLASVWGEVLQFNTLQDTPVPHDQFAADAPDAPVVAELAFNLAIAENTVSFSVLFPYDALSTLHSVESSKETTPDNTLWRTGLKRQLVGCELDVHGVLAETTISVKQLLKLQAGDFIPLGNIQTATFSTGSTPLFEAVIGASNGRVSASISHWLGQGETTEGAVSHDYFKQ